MSFKITKAFFDGRVLPFTLTKNDSEWDNHYTIVVGKNSIGKSRLLSAIIGSFESLDEGGRVQKNRSGLGRRADAVLDKFSLVYEKGGIVAGLTVNHGKCQYSGEFILGVSPSDTLPNKIVATSTTPYDKFPLGRNSFKRPDTEYSRYTYLGVRSEFGPQSSNSLLDRLVGSLFRSSREGQLKLEKLKGVFNFLGYLPKLTAEYQFDISPSRFLSLVSDQGLNPSDSQSRHPRVRRALDVLSGDDVLLRKVVEAYGELEEDLHTARRIGFDIGFDGGCLSGSVIELFEHTELLRNLGLMRLADIHLYPEYPAIEPVSVRDLSSGEQCIIATIIGIASEIEDGSLICIDEPEISLHPEWQEKYIDLLLRTFDSYRGCHFIIATHSPQIISRVHGANCAILKMNTGELLPSDKYYKKSADFQLAKIFCAPGSSNEYVTRECLNLIAKISKGSVAKSEIRQEAKPIIEMRPLLKENDPVSTLIDALILALEYEG
ncbi:AAA family ATPase [Microbulbifer harenosus]|uniref:ATP-binding protein n=1 Tax=Microbulbifer harenosus TaxID=2576840 RepID=A0ABY2UKN6_9GAMM|nr:AAA family ATPase [Microbulbifer harenosus]TLM78601.1 ATP-binding protein [Microbulbifer harenosus]